MKKVVGVLLLCLGFMFIFSGINVKADEKVYDIQQANFVVNLDENGDAYIIETWTIDF